MAGIWSLDHRGGFDLSLKVECDGETENRQNDVGWRDAGRMIANAQWATNNRFAGTFPVAPSGATISGWLTQISAPEANAAGEAVASTKLEMMTCRTSA